MNIPRFRCVEEASTGFDSISMSECSMDFDTSSPEDNEPRVIERLKDERRPFRRCGFGVVVDEVMVADAEAAASVAKVAVMTPETEARTVGLTPPDRFLLLRILGVIGVV